MATARGRETVNAALVILNPRDIPVCKQALAELAIPKLWLTGWTEKQIADDVFPRLLSDYCFEQYLLVSDDAIVRQHAVQAVLDELRWNPVVTGYSQRSHTDWQVNLTRGPLKYEHPVVGAYDFLSYHEVVSHPEPTLPTWFAGMSITGMSREMWQRFPFGCYSDEQSPNGYASDFHLSRRLQDAGVPITACRDAFAYHWRHEWRHTNDRRDDKLLVGSITPAVTLT
jgi:hypothetical protein